jgi:hypothetical protein
MRRRILALVVLVLMLVAMMAFAGLAFAQEAAHGCQGINEALSHTTPKGKVPHFVPPAKDVVPGLFIPPFRVPCPAP